MSEPTKGGAPMAAREHRSRAAYANLFPRFFNALTTMATTPGSVKERLAWVADDVCVFADSQLPAPVLPLYQEFEQLVYSGKVPLAYTIHHHPVKSTRTYWISRQKAQRAGALLVEMFSIIVTRREGRAGEHDG